MAKSEDVPLFAQNAVLLAEPGELLALLGGEALAPTGIDVGPADPLPYSCLGQVQVAGGLADRAITSAAQLDDIRLELRREGSPGTLLSAVHDGILPGAGPSWWMSVKTGQAQLEEARRVALTVMDALKEMQT